MLSRRGAELKGRRQLEALAALEADAGNVRSAWQWAVGAHLHVHLARRWTGWGCSTNGAGCTRMRRLFCHHAAQSLAGAEAAPGILLLANLLRWQARFSRYLGRGPVAKELAQRSLDVLDSRGFGG